MKNIFTNRQYWNLLQYINIGDGYLVHNVDIYAGNRTTTKIFLEKVLFSSIQTFAKIKNKMISWMTLICVFKDFW